MPKRVQDLYFTTVLQVLGWKLFLPSCIFKYSCQDISVRSSKAVSTHHFMTQNLFEEPPDLLTWSNFSVVAPFCPYEVFPDLILTLCRDVVVGKCSVLGTLKASCISQQSNKPFLLRVITLLSPCYTIKRSDSILSWIYLSRIHWGGDAVNVYFCVRTCWVRERNKNCD